jgi:hypothetical protein
MVRDHVPVTVDFLVDISHEVIELGRPAILHFLFASFLTHLPREVAIDVNIWSDNVALLCVKRLFASGQYFFWTSQPTRTDVWRGPTYVT